MPSEWSSWPPRLDQHTTEAEEWLEHVAEAVFAEYSEWFKPDGCILGTRLFVGVMEALGVPHVDGASVVELIYNPPAAAHLREHNCDPMQCDLGEVPDAVVAGMGSNPKKGRSDYGKWGGHLIATVGDTWAVDTTISQIANPQYQLDVSGTLTFPIDASWMAGDSWAILGGRGDSGAELMVASWHHKPDDREWRNAADWQLNLAVSALIAGSLARLHGTPKPRYPAAMVVGRAALGRV